MRLIQWNIGYGADIEKISLMLREHAGDSYIAALEEVIPAAYEKIREQFPDIRYSLDYRRPGKFDTKARQLGIAFITSPDIEIVDAIVYERALLPDRTLLIKFQVNGTEYCAAAFHAITGVSHLKAKSHQFCSMAECLDICRPDIVMIDANEPERDHYDVAEMKFFERNGKGAGIFFNELSQIGLRDAYAIDYDRTRYIEGEPLAVSHIIRQNGRKCRYDHIFVADRIKVTNIEYLYEEAVKATADHAMVAADIELN